MAKASSTLVTHCGGRTVTLDELGRYRAPPPEGRHFPIDHTQVRRRVLDTLDAAGFVVRREQLAVAKEGARFFGVLDLSTRVNDEVALAVGVRSSYDKSLCLSLCFGTRVFLCDNLAMVSENHVRRKHTRFGEQRFNAGIAEAVSKLSTFKEEEARRIAAMRGVPINDTVAESLVLRSWEAGVLSVRQLGDALAEWRRPSFDAFSERSLWSFYNCMTTLLGRGERATKQPGKFVSQTMLLHSLVEKAGAEQAQQFLAG